MNLRLPVEPVKYRSLSFRRDTFSGVSDAYLRKYFLLLNMDMDTALILRIFDRIVKDIENCLTRPLFIMILF